MPEHLPLSPGLPGSVAGAHRGGAALAPAPESCRGDPRAGGERWHTQSGWGLRAVGRVAVLPVPSSAAMPACGTGCLSMVVRGCARVGAAGTCESRLEMGYGRVV